MSGCTVPSDRDGLEKVTHLRGHTGRVAEHTLILLRHSKSDWSGDEPDIDRPLAERGRRQASEAGQWLATHVGRIDLAVVSTAERARATWDLVSTELGERPETRHDEDAYAASAGDLRDMIRSLGEELGTVVLVGHNPGLEGLAETLIGDPVPLPTSALAVIELDSPWRSAGRPLGHLRTAGRPPTG
jgi:phosphohistidine phosphatase